MHAGAASVETILYILCQKVLHPSKWMLLRGNHETRDMNG